MPSAKRETKGSPETKPKGFKTSLLNWAVMIIWNELRLLHENLPYPLLRLWGRSKKVVSLSQRLAVGSRYAKCCKLLEDMQEWPTGKVYEFQLESLKKILEHANNNVPYYTNMFNKVQLKPSSIKCLEDLQKLPILTKEDILINYKKLFAKNLWYKRRIYRYTSGTSGKALKMCLDEESIGAISAAVQDFRRTFLNYKSGESIVMHAPVSNSPYLSFFLRTTKDYLYSPVTKTLFFSERMNEHIFEEYITLIKRFKISHVEGSPSLYYAFARYAAGKNEDVRFKTALLVGEVLYGFQRELIKKSLNCEVFNRYGQIESILNACECGKHSGMHISPLTGIAEVKDSGLKGDGRLVVTGLWNRLFPLIRYDTGDVAELSQNRCRCGCNFPQRLMRIEGRGNDFIMLPDGGCLHPMPFTWLNKSVKGIKDIFLLQNKDYTLDVFVVKEDAAGPDNVSKLIEQKIRKLSQDKLKIRITFTDRIERRSRKYRVVETKIPAFQK